MSASYILFPSCLSPNPFKCCPYHPPVSLFSFCLCCLQMSRCVVFKCPVVFCPCPCLLFPVLLFSVLFILCLLCVMCPFVPSLSYSALWPDPFSLYLSLDVLTVWFILPCHTSLSSLPQASPLFWYNIVNAFRIYHNKVWVCKVTWVLSSPLPLTGWETKSLVSNAEFLVTTVCVGRHVWYYY